MGTHANNRPLTWAWNWLYRAHVCSQLVWVELEGGGLDEMESPFCTNNPRYAMVGEKCAQGQFPCSAYPFLPTKQPSSSAEKTHSPMPLRESLSSEDLPLQKGCPNHFLHIRLITSPSGKKTKECVCLSLSPSNSFCLCLSSKHKSVLCSAPHVSSVFWPCVLQTVVWGHRVYAVMVHLSHIVRQLPVSLWQTKAYVSVWLQTPGAPDTGR